jgi:hypothetical protein
MRASFTILFILVLAPFFCWAQADTSFRLVNTITGDIAAFTTDNLDNVYILTSNNAVKKLNSRGDSVAVYNDVRKYGQVSLLDVSNPLKVLVYYKDFSTIVVLDRFLNVRNTIDLRRQNIFQVKAIGQSYDNKIWLFDEIDNKLKKIDEDGKLLQETPDFRLLLSSSFSPLKIFDQDKLVYLYDPQKGVYVFDYFGTLKNGIQIFGWDNFKVTGRFIFGSRADSLYRYDINTFLYDEWKLPVPASAANSFNFSSSRFYALRRNSAGKSSTVSVYTIQ